MPWKGVTMNEERLRFLQDHQLGCYSVSDLAERFSVSRQTAHKWIRRAKKYGETGFHELSRRPYNSPSQTDPATAQELVTLRKAHPSWGARKLLDLLHRRHPAAQLPSPSTACRILRRQGLVRSRRRFRRTHPGAPKSLPKHPNDVWAADYKGQFRLKNASYCFPLTVSDLASRYLLGVDAHPTISLELTQKHFTRLFREFGLPNRIRTDNGVPFASSALARLSALSVWFIKLGIYPELIEPGRPQQNAVHERMHRTLKREATIPPASSLSAQQRRFDAFRQEFNHIRPHEALAMHRPAQLYRPSTRSIPRRLETYDYPSHFLVRRVSRDGTIRLLSKQCFVSNTLHDDFVGLEEIDDGIFDLFFCFYQIGRYHLIPNTIEDIVSRVPVSRRQIDLARRVSAMS
jgi:transposase InsO family protein